MMAWTEFEDEKLLALIECDVPRFQTPRYFTFRSPHAVKSRYDKIMRELGRAPSIEKRSKELAAAINALIDRMPANDVLAVLGTPSQPRIIRAPYKTQSAMRRLAA